MLIDQGLGYDLGAVYVLGSRPSWCFPFVLTWWSTDESGPAVAGTSFRPRRYCSYTTSTDVTAAAVDFGCMDAHVGIG